VSENSSIEWTDHTFNTHWGCTKISPAVTDATRNRLHTDSAMSGAMKRRGESSAKTIGKTSFTGIGRLRRKESADESSRTACQTSSISSLQRCAASGTGNLSPAHRTSTICY